MRGIRICAAFLVLMAASACGGDARVGTGINPEELDAQQERLGELLREEAAGEEDGGGFLGRDGAEVESAGDPGEDAAAQQAERDRQIQEQREAAAIEFFITQQGFDPYYIRVFQGGVVRVTNRDEQARSIKADNGRFDSGLIQPGQSWSYEATEVGRFNFHDGTRPYAVGTLEVLTP